MEMQSYIKPELLILIPVIYLIGIAIKKSTVKDKFIPFILGGISVVLCTIWIFATCETLSATDILYSIFGAITQGVLVAGASVYANQLIKQGKETDEGENTEAKG